MRINHPLRKVICQYDLNGNLINEFLSLHEAHKTTGIDRACITKCCNGKKSYNSTNGFYFRFKDNYFPLVESNIKKISISQYIDDLLVNTFNSYTDAERNGFSRSSIRKVLNTDKKHKGFIWKSTVK